MSEDSFTKKKRMLRMYYKQLRVGITTWENVPKEFQFLLRKYYPHICPD